MPDNYAVKECIKCGNRYDWRHSLSSLPMTYCNTICEANDLGFHLDTWLRQPAKVRPVITPLPAIPEEEPIAQVA